MSKKDRELLVLKEIYQDGKVVITESEQPDFIINGIDEQFGVEITDYYYNESSARLKNKPGYFESIINSPDNTILTQRDKGAITKQSIYVKDSNDDKYKFLLDSVGVKYNEHYDYGVDPTYEDVENQLIDIINVKSVKANDYQKLDYYELFIQDRENYFARDSQRQLRLNNSKTLLDVVAQSNYKRVYIFSEKVLCIIGYNPNENLAKYEMFADSNKGDGTSE